jgi:hypothetical protein
MAQLTEGEALKLLMEKYKETADAARTYAHASKREEFLAMGLLLESMQKKCARLAAIGMMGRITR